MNNYSENEGCQESNDSVFNQPYVDSNALPEQSNPENDYLKSELEALRSSISDLELSNLALNKSLLDNQFEIRQLQLQIEELRTLYQDGGATCRDNVGDMACNDIQYNINSPMGEFADTPKQAEYIQPASVPDSADDKPLFDNINFNFDEAFVLPRNDGSSILDKSGVTPAEWHKIQFDPAPRPEQDASSTGENNSKSSAKRVSNINDLLKKYKGF